MWRSQTDGKNSDNCDISGKEVPRTNLRGLRRVLLFHISVIVNVNERSLDFLGLEDEGNKIYSYILYGTVVREVTELDKKFASEENNLKVVSKTIYQ